MWKSIVTLRYSPTYAFGSCLPRTCRSEYGFDEEAKIPESRLTLCNLCATIYKN